MDDAKRRAVIRLKVVKNKDTDVDAMGTGSSKPFAKKRPLPKGDVYLRSRRSPRSPSLV